MTHSPHPTPNGDAAKLKARASEAANEAAERARMETERRAAEGKTRVSGAAQRVAEAFDDAADDMAESGPARPALRRAAAGARGVADMVDDSSIGDVVDSIDRFARRSPAAFLGVAALTGFAMARFASARPLGHDAFDDDLDDLDDLDDYGPGGADPLDRTRDPMAGPLATEPATPPAPAGPVPAATPAPGAARPATPGMGPAVSGSTPPFGAVGDKEPH